MPVRNSEALEALRRAAGLQQGIDTTPAVIPVTVQPTIEINPLLVGGKAVIASTAAKATGSASITVYTVPSGYDFYLTDCTMRVRTNGTSNAAPELRVVINGLTVILLCDDVENNDMISRSFVRPILLDRASSVTLVQDTDAESFASISGLLLENRG